MELELSWKKGLPEKDGLYFVAMKLGEGAGVYDFLNWDGRGWQGLEVGEVIAFVTLQDFKNSLKVNWPDDAAPLYTARTLSDDDSDLWSES